VIAALALAMDLAIGVELEHGMRSTLLAMRLADRLGWDPEIASQTITRVCCSTSDVTPTTTSRRRSSGGDVATDFMPATFGSRVEMLAGLLRMLPTPGSATIPGSSRP
jgi:hypothetical protein